MNLHTLVNPNTITLLTAYLQARFFPAPTTSHLEFDGIAYWETPRDGPRFEFLIEPVDHLLAARFAIEGEFWLDPEYEDEFT